jgi:predicted enzyme related to lactoylglutathione lyase
MPRPGIRSPGSPVWLDLNSSNPDASISFYGDLFGWKASREGPEMGNYVNFSLNGEPVAGMTPNPGGEKDSWTTYLKTVDAAQTANAIAQHGGEVLFNEQVMQFGSMVIFTDPTGATAAAWQAGTHDGFNIVSEAGAPAWHELHTRDYEAALAFYSLVFGIVPTRMPGAPEFEMATFGSSDGPTSSTPDATENFPTGGILAASSTLAPGEAPFWAVYFAVTNTDESVEKLVTLGGRVLEPAVNTPFGRMAKAADVTGASLSLIQVQ